MTSSAHWLEIERRDDVAVVHLLHPEWFGDQAIADVGQQLADLVESQGCRKLVLDLAPVERLSSDMVGEMLVLNKKMRQADGKLVLCALRPELQEIFSLLRLNQLFSIRANVEAALSALACEGG